MQEAVLARVERDGLAVGLEAALERSRRREIDDLERPEHQRILRVARARHEAVGHLVRGRGRGRG